MRLDRLHRAYPSLHPFGVVHWVPVLSNIKTANGCDLNRPLQLWTVFAGTVVYNYQFKGIQGWAGQLCQIRSRALANAWRSRSKHILQWRYYTAMKYQFIHSFIHCQWPCIVNARPAWNNWKTSLKDLSSWELDQLRNSQSSDWNYDGESVSRQFSHSIRHIEVEIFCPIDVLSGYNGTIFAYGQTASGKTHTMEVGLIISNLSLLISMIIICSSYALHYLLR